MCGIVGYSGKTGSLDVLLEGLHKLEYRGYDSAGVALSYPDGIRVAKAQGRLSALEEKLAGLHLPGQRLRHRTYPLGHPWRAQRCEQPPPLGSPGKSGPQRHHRKLRPAAGISGPQRVRILQ